MSDFEVNRLSELLNVEEESYTEMDLAFTSKLNSALKNLKKKA